MTTQTPEQLRAAREHYAALTDAETVQEIDRALAARVDCSEVAVTIPGLAYDDAFELIMDARFPDDVNHRPHSAELATCYAYAETRRRGRGYSHTIILPARLLAPLREELQYRYEMNGGEGNPYGIDPDELRTYSRAKVACMIAVQRVTDAIIAGAAR